MVALRGCELLINAEFAVLKIAARCQSQVDFLVCDNAAVIHLRGIVLCNRQGGANDGFLLFRSEKIILFQPVIFRTRLRTVRQFKGELFLCLRQLLRVDGCNQLMLFNQVVQRIGHGTPRQQRFRAAGQIRALPDKQALVLPVKAHAGIIGQQKLCKNILVAFPHKAQPVNEQGILIIKGKILGVVCSGRSLHCQQLRQERGRKFRQSKSGGRLLALRLCGCFG